jgi:hypothetical protein
MTDAEKIESKLAELRKAGQTEVARQLDPAGHERNPPAFQRQQEREGRSEWSGGSMGGGTWGGRSR